MKFSAPQGSTQGAFFFISYASKPDEVVPKDMQCNRFRDDHSIQKGFKLTDESATSAAMESTMLDVKY